MTALPIVDPIAGYRPSVDGHDEMMDADGGIRDHWSGVTAAYRTLGTVELARRRAEIQMLLEQDGVTYNNPKEPNRQHRAWTLDPVPFIVPTDEWTVIERGMIQRAELLNLVLDDLYGERRLLRDGVLPPAMILSDPQFLRACDGIRLPGDKQLVVFAADLARGADGSWLTLGHRTQAPSGAAYALENRRVMSRVFPHLFRSAGVARLAPFIQAMRSTLLAAVPDGVDDPSIVILSPGSLSETAFEHASLAAQLGYPLVQGSDLQCRDGRVGLRTVGGWVPVHVILRRVDAGFCDPLELRSDSTLGIPGLTDACRGGTVGVVNTLGSGILENAGLSGLMGTLAKHLLGSDLVLDSVPSWWCGDPASRSHVLTHLGELIVRPLSRSTHSINTALASAAELGDLRRRILARPDQWVGQERLVPGSAPVLTDTGIGPRATVVRTFAVADGDTYVAMSGGLARAASGSRAGPITNLAGAESKDMWVLGTDATRVTLSRPEDFDPTHAPVIDALPARAAEYLFWLGRYAERAEATVRLIRTINARRDEFDQAPPGPGPASLAALLQALTRITGTYPGFVGDDAGALLDDPTDELFSLVVDEHRPGTVAHAIRHMFEAIDVVRDQLSIDTWLVVGSLQRELERLAHDGGDTRAGDTTASVLDALLPGLLSLAGLANESMVRDQGWQFMEAGRRIERALHVTVLVGSALNTEHSAPVESLIIESVLTAGESIITARRRYRSHVITSTTIDLLFCDRGNPRSLAFQLDRLGESLALLRSTPGATSPAVQLLDEVSQLAGGIDPLRLAHVDATGYRPDLDQFVSTVRTKLSMISKSIEAESFTRFRPQRAMVGPIDNVRLLEDPRVDVDGPT